MNSQQGMKPMRVTGWIPVLILILLVAPASATIFNFQDSDSFYNLYAHHTLFPDTGPPVTWPYPVLNHLGTSKYHISVRVLPSNGVLLPKLGTEMDYMSLDADGQGILDFYDINEAYIESVNFNAMPVNGGSGRSSIERVGSNWKVYHHGVLQATVASVGTSVYRIAIRGNVAGAYIDNIIVGGLDKGVIDCLPRDWYVKRDLLDPTVYGVYNASNAVVDTKDFTIEASVDEIDTYTITTKNIVTGATINSTSFVVSQEPWGYYGYNNPGGYGGPNVTYRITDLLFTTGAPTGVYSQELRTDAGDLLDTGYFEYITTGATIQWDATTYSSGDTATITTTVSPSYWDAGVYSYEGRVYDLYGSKKTSWALTATSQTQTVSLSDYATGDYVAVVVATKKSDGTEYWMAYDLATISDYVTIMGYGINAYTGAKITGASVKMLQSASWFNTTTDGTGAYNLTGFIYDLEIGINASKSSYNFTPFAFNPPAAQTYHINLSFVPDYVPNNTALMGVVYEDWSHNAIPGATVRISNDTWTGTSTTASATGFYMFNGQSLVCPGESYRLNATASGYTQSIDYSRSPIAGEALLQNIEMTPQYVLTVHLYDAASNTPLLEPVYVTVSDGQNANTSAGSVTFTLAFGVYTITASATGYNGDSETLVMMGSRSITLHLTERTETAQQSSTWYSPHQVRFIIVGSPSGEPLENVTVTARFNQSTLMDPSWQQTLFGISSSVSPGLNVSSMGGVTGTDGAIVFTMLASFQYVMRFTDASRSISHQITVYPQQGEYTIWIPLGVTYPNLQEAFNNSLFVTEISSSQVALNMTFNDTALQTKNVTFYVITPSNDTIVYSKSWVGTNTASDSFIVQNVRGDSYIWGYFSMGSTWPNQTPVSLGITLKGPSGVLVDLGFSDLRYYVWISFTLLMLIGGIFTSERTSYFGAVLTPACGLVFWWFGWIDVGLYFGAVSLMFVLGILVYMKSSFRRAFGIGGPGSILLSIIIYLVILQATIGLVNGLGAFHSFASTQDNAYTRWDIAQAKVDFNNVGGVGGVLSPITDLLAAGWFLITTGLKIMWSIITAIFYIEGTLFDIFHFNSTPQLVLLAHLIQIGEYILMGLFLFVTFYKPPPGEAQF